MTQDGLFFSLVAFAAIVIATVSASLIPTKGEAVMVWSPDGNALSIATSIPGAILSASADGSFTVYLPDGEPPHGPALILRAPSWVGCAPITPTPPILRS